MPDSKILQAILDGQTSIRENIKRVGRKVDDGFEEVKGRLNKIGLSLANLENDTPTIEEFDNLEKRVNKLEKHRLSA